MEERKNVYLSLHKSFVREGFENEKYTAACGILYSPMHR